MEVVAPRDRRASQVVHSKAPAGPRAWRRLTAPRLRPSARRRARRRQLQALERWCRPRPRSGMTHPPGGPRGSPHPLPAPSPRLDRRASEREARKHRAHSRLVVRQRTGSNRRRNLATPLRQQPQRSAELSPLPHVLAATLVGFEGGCKRRSGRQAHTKERDLVDTASPRSQRRQRSRTAATRSRWALPRLIALHEGGREYRH